MNTPKLAITLKMQNLSCFPLVSSCSSPPLNSEHYRYTPEDWGKKKSTFFQLISCSSLRSDLRGKKCWISANHQCKFGGQDILLRIIMEGNVSLHYWRVRYRVLIHTAHPVLLDQTLRNIFFPVCVSISYVTIRRILVASLEQKAPAKIGLSNTETFCVFFGRQFLMDLLCFCTSCEQRHCVFLPV